ncbi:hypothetical protein [Mycobacterium sp. UM_Kg1]|uniref:hypothetical protein n=1 Tax=Mycobacterium sp. UM_Kg1 TaxID=1545691 RepID=UPI00061B26AF|nr:hypothetical protein [Mycobacterium sp. UM_Kg1]
MGVLLWFAPWGLYWVLVGNAPPVIAAAVALAAALAAAATAREPSLRVLAGGALATFTLLAVLPWGFAATHNWLLPLSFAGLFATLLIGVALRRSAVEAVATADVVAPVVQSELFAPLVQRLTWVWLGALATMTAVAAVPPIALAESASRQPDDPLIYLCCWVIPFAILTATVIGSRLLADRMTAGFGDAVRKTSFVAFVDLEIDQLYYLATEHANREVGPGEEAYSVTVGTKGTPLVGDETRVSWPSTYKVRQRRG